MPAGAIIWFENSVVLAKVKPAQVVQRVMGGLRRPDRLGAPCRRPVGQPRLLHSLCRIVVHHAAVTPQGGMRLLLSEVKGPVMDRLQGTDFGRRMQGQVFLSTHAAFADVAAHKRE